MTTWYNASQGVIEAANVAMEEIAKTKRFSDDRDAALRAVWEPLANALMEAVPDDLESDWPALFRSAGALGPDFVGITSDTRRIVAWGADTGIYRPFDIL